MATNEQDVTIDIVPLYPVDDFEAACCLLYQQITPRDMARLTWELSDPPTSLRTFLNYLASPTHAPFLALHGEDIAGVFILHNITSGIQCEFGGWIPYRYRGLGSESIMHQSLVYVAEKMQLPTVFVKTPWEAARQISKRAGMKEIAAIDYHTGTKANKLYLLRWDYGGRRRKPTRTTATSASRKATDTARA